MASPLPPILKPLLPITKQATLLEKYDAIMSYYCKLYATQLGISLMGNDQTAKKYVIGLLTQCEMDKKQIGSLLNEDGMQKDYVENFAYKVFDVADNQDRAGHPTKDTAKSFYAAATFFDVLKQFGELDTEKQKYAKWRAAKITQAINSGVAPPPPPSNPTSTEDALDQELAALGPGPGGYGGAPASQSSFPDFLGVPQGNNHSSPGAFPDFPTIPQTKAAPPSFPDFPTAPSSSRSSFPDFSQSNQSTLPQGGKPASNSPSFPDFPSMTSSQPAKSSQPSFPDFPGMQQSNSSNSPFPSFPSMPQGSPHMDMSPPPYPGKPAAPDFPNFPQQPQLTQQSQQSQFPQPQQSQFPQQSQQSQFPQPQQSQFPQQSQQPQFPPQFPQQSQPQRPPQQRQPVAPTPAPTPAPAPAPAPTPVPAPAPTLSNYSPSDADKELAQKYAKFVISALDYQDVPTAVKNLKLALLKLTGVQY